MYFSPLNFWFLLGFCKRLLCYLAESTSRICRFYASREGCFEGKNCKFLHLEQGKSVWNSASQSLFPELCNKQMEVAVVNSSSVLKLPGEGEWLVAIVTAVVSPTRFYIQLPLGCKSPLALHQSDREEADDGMCLCVYMCYSCGCIQMV